MAERLVRDFNQTNGTRDDNLAAQGGALETAQSLVKMDIVQQMRKQISLYRTSLAKAREPLAVVEGAANHNHTGELRSAWDLLRAAEHIGAGDKSVVEEYVHDVDDFYRSSLHP